MNATFLHLSLPTPSRCAVIIAGILILSMFTSSLNAQDKKLKFKDQRDLSTFESTPITLKLSDFTIEGPGENRYPEGFSLVVYDGDNYSVSGHTVTPDAGFIGELRVEIRIRYADGNDEYETKKERIRIQVKRLPENAKPVIIAQVPLQTPKNQSLAITFSHLTVVDPDDPYPNGFKMNVLDGDNYTVVNSTVTPSQNFVGTLIVPVQVNDGHSSSEFFNVKISVVEEGTSGPQPQPGNENNAPVFTNFNSAPLQYSLGASEFYVAREVTIDDPDSPELLYAEVYFEPSQFQPGKDQLLVQASESISAVFDSDRGILVLFGNSSLESYQNALRSVRYNFNNDTLPSIKTKQLNFRLNDGANFSEVASRNVVINEGVLLDIPNVFSPNNDDAHDYWVVRPKRNSDNLKLFVRVFDRHGELVFETSELENYWDGRYNGNPVPEDTYFYLITYSQGPNQVKQQGVVNVLR